MVEPSAANQTMRKLRWVNAPAKRFSQVRGGSISVEDGGDGDDIATDERSYRKARPEPAWFDCAHHALSLSRGAKQTPAHCPIATIA